VVESLMVPENGDLGAAYAPFVGTLPPTVERGFRAGGLAVAPGYTRADYRASFRKLEDLVGAIHKAGVQIVAGTDGSGLELVRELELYVDSGFTPAEALQAATLAPARLQHADDHTGIIAPGKNADLLLVEGDPSKNIGDLRHSRMVMMDGALMNCDELRSVAGIAGRPKYSD
jgi:imidazolonepropionase-like amidohydrolase